MCYDGNPWQCNGHGMMDRVSEDCVCNAGYIGCGYGCSASPACWS